MSFILLVFLLYLYYFFNDYFICYFHYCYMFLLGLFQYCMGSISCLSGVSYM
ncbi:hypothetical protein CLU79DRAFT_782982 [Phycomyces nitens]|nr:hypothetical protein CLU79DRAFT_782982 [Phycomyces nitens]